MTKAKATIPEKTAPSWHPMIFTGESVRAMLAGRKVMTRRVVKEPRDKAIGSDGKPCGYMLYDLGRAWADHGFPTDDAGEPLPIDQWPTASPAQRRNHYLHVPFAHPSDGWEKDPKDDTSIRLYPRWDAGDFLWVKERYLTRESGRYVAYEADFADSTEAAGFGAMYGGWKTPLFMRPEYSRLSLEVLSVRVERLQEISAQDVWDEGARCDCMSPVPACKGNIDAFRASWFKIHGAKSWDANPWVWVLTLRVKP